MARQTFSSSYGQHINDQFKRLAAVLLSATNEDTSAYTLPISGTVAVSSGGGAAAASTATLTNVNDSNVSATLLAANSSRLGATIFNDSDQILYVKFGTTASSSSFTVKMAAGDYYEVPYLYTGKIDGIWAADSTGAARITEFTA